MQEKRGVLSPDSPLSSLLRRIHQTSTRSPALNPSSWHSMTSSVMLVHFQPCTASDMRTDLSLSRIKCCCSFCPETLFGLISHVWIRNRSSCALKTLWKYQRQQQRRRLILHLGRRSAQKRNKEEEAHWTKYTVNAHQLPIGILMSERVLHIL